MIKGFYIKLIALLKKQFERLDMFGGKPPNTLKRISKAYYQAKHSPLNGYIHNYNLYKTATQKLDYLHSKGLIDPKGKIKSYSAAQIEILFIQHKNKMLSTLEMDIGTVS